MIYKEILLNNNDVLYFKFNNPQENLNSGFENTKPYVSFNLGVKLQGTSWTGFDTTFQGEDGFVMFGDEFYAILKKLGSLINDYKEDEIIITDFEGDTDAEIHIKCEKSRALIFGHLGQDYNWTDDSDDNIQSPVLKFKTETTSDCLVKLYEIFNEMISL